MIFKRRPLPKGIRHEVFIRDHYKCTECGAGKEKYSLEVDHIVSISKGGTDEMSNLRTLCEPCNREKNDLVHENHNPKGLEQFEIELSKKETIEIEKYNPSDNAICSICQFHKIGANRIILIDYSTKIKYDKRICIRCYIRLLELLSDKKDNQLRRELSYGNLFQISEKPPTVFSIPDNNQLKFYCGFCKDWHRHGNMEGHRIAHCGNNSPFRNIGYYLKKATIPDGLNSKQRLELERGIKENWKAQFLIE